MCGVVVSEKMSIGLSLTDREHRKVRVWASMEGLLLREFYEAAFEFFVKRRARTDRRPTYLAVPSNARTVSSQIGSGVAESLREAAVEDRASYVNAYYTAIKMYLEYLAENKKRLLEELLEGGESV